LVDKKNSKKQVALTNDVIVSGNEINPEKIYLKTKMLGSGAFGEVWLVHHKDLDRDFAMKMLESKLVALKEKENKATINDLKGIQMDIAWGSQIRSYVFCPYTMVKDHRTNYETGNIQAVMDGEIDGFIESYLKSNIK